MVFHGTKITVLDERWASLGFRNYDEIMDWEDNFISKTLTTQVYWVGGDQAVLPGGVYLKKVLSNYWGRYFLRRAKSAKELRNYRIMQQIGVPVPRVIAVGERRRFGGLIDAFIMTEGVAESETLEDYAKTHPQRDEAFIGICQQLADIVRGMHRAGFYHIDLQWRNVLVKRESGQGSVRVFLIDCPRGGRRRLPLRCWNGKMHDLAGLEKLGKVYLSPKERLRWFKAYNAGRKFSRADRRMIEAIRKELGKRESK
jgi:tRNA A-37 threonylcarbamoyl transferase component Bud32